MKEALLKLKMRGALNVLDDLSKSKMDNVSFVKCLLEAEIMERQLQTGIKKIKSAKFSYEREWQQISTKRNPKIPFAEIKKLSSGVFFKARKNICFINSSQKCLHLSP